MIQLLEDRPQRTEIKDGTTFKGIFIKKGKYKIVREIKGLGWLVYTDNDDKNPQNTIIKYDEGVLCD